MWWAEVPRDPSNPSPTKSILIFRKISDVSFHAGQAAISQIHVAFHNFHIWACDDCRATDLGILSLQLICRIKFGVLGEFETKKI